MLRLNFSRVVPVPWLTLTFTAILVLALATSAVRGQEDDILSFVPSGGRTLVADLQGAGASDEAIKGMLAEDRDAAGWLEWIEASRGEVPGLEAFDDYQTRTLANYLASVAPMDAAGMPGDSLPRDGRDMALRYCQSCHIITVSITQDRTREAWLSTLNNPSHVEIEMDERERGLLADYYVVNGAIPIEQVPPALRAGGASY